jgi:hypothetical protein
MRPETTGETENGRSMRVMSRLLPRNSNLADRPGRGEAEDEVQRHRNGGDDERELTAASASGSVTACQNGSQPLRKAS